MKKMRWLIITAAVVLLLSGCNMVQVNPERDAETVVAKVKDQVITKGEFYQQYNMYKYYQGVTPAIEADPNYAATIQTLKEQVLTFMINQKVILIKAKELNCYDFTDEQKADIEEQLQNAKESYKQAYIAKLKGEEANKDKTDEELDKMAEEGLDAYIEDIGANLDDQKKMIEDSIAYENAYAKVTDVTPPTDEEVQAIYDQNVAAQQEGYDNGTVSYEQLANQDQEVYVVPEDARKAQHILIKLDATTIQNIQTLRQNGDEEGADKALEEALPSIKEATDAAYERVTTGGEDFEAVMKEIGEDPGMESKDAYIVLKFTKMFYPAFATGLFSLENVGDISEPVATDFGYHIIKYVGDIPAGTVSFETVKQGIYDGLLETKKNEAFDEKVSAWAEELGVQKHMDRIG